MQFYTTTESQFLKNPLRIVRTTKYIIHGKYSMGSIFNGNLTDLNTILSSSEPITCLSLFGLSQEELESLPKELFVNAEKIRFYGAKHSFDFLEDIKSLQEVYLNCNADNVDYKERMIKLWDTSKNPVLDKLVLGHPEIDDISKLENSTISYFEIERGGFYLEDDMPVKIKTDFSVFLTMKNLKVLKLWIEPIKDNYNNLVALSKLTDLQEIYLPKHYFTFMQFAYLKSKLKAVKGLEVFREFRNRQQERYEFMRIGSDTPREFIPMSEELMEIDRKEFNMLVEEFENIDTPPTK